MTRLPVLAGRVTCVPFHADLSARSCVARHRATYAMGRSQFAAPERSAAHPTCAGCSVGAALAKGGR